VISLPTGDQKVVPRGGLPFTRNLNNLPGGGTGELPKGPLGFLPEWSPPQEHRFSKSWKASAQRELIERGCRTGRFDDCPRRSAREQLGVPCAADSMSRQEFSDSLKPNRRCRNLPS